MKRAKIVLTAVALFAVVGGALAFKASRIKQPLFSTNANGRCVVETSTYYTTAPQFGQVGTVTNLFATTPNPAGACPLTTLYTID